MKPAMTLTVLSRASVRTDHTLGEVVGRQFQEEETGGDDGYPALDGDIFFGLVHLLRESKGLIFLVKRK